MSSCSIQVKFYCDFSSLVHKKINFQVLVVVNTGTKEKRFPRRRVSLRGILKMRFVVPIFPVKMTSPS